ncbi:DUF4229 domain-containing protein [Thermoactinospora rubra]|uniref:DUF4229 domain-containing protein n=1 Tax=Thermoactinospora rubra TaxID=1088767 RepID=UPI000A0F6021|nr:DUF4229 domain-containing protein [Thermoactinospora rubra]
MHPVLVYTLSRIGLFLVALGLLYVLGMRSWLLILAAAVFSGIASYVLLSKQRDAVSARLSQKLDRPRPEDG